MGALSDDISGVDNSEIATILRRALMDLVVTFKSIEQQVTAVPGGCVPSNCC